MKTCKEGCGGKMKNVGKVATMKKMKVGGNTADPCFPLCLKAGECKPCLSTRLGDALVKTGAVLFGKKVLKDAKKNAGNKKKTPTKTEAAQETVQEKRIGGTTNRKYAMGGNTGGYAPAQKGGDNTKNGIYGIPNAGRTDSLGFKKGGSTTSRAVKPGCRGGMVKDASGNCVAERKFKAGGTVNKKFAALAPPYNKATFADRIAGAKKKVVKKKK